MRKFLGFLIVLSNILVGAETETPEFWLNKLSNIDKVLLPPQKINSLNYSIREQGYILKPLRVGPTISGKCIEGFIEREITYFNKYIKYTKTWQRVYSDPFNNWGRSICNKDGIPPVAYNKFCIVTTKTSLRSLPTDEPIYGQDSDSDLLQKTTFDVGSELIIYHTTKDGKWGFVDTKFCEGWIKLSDVAYTYDGALVYGYAYPYQDKFIVITDWKVSILNDKFKEISKIRMGERLPYLGVTNGYYLVKLPIRGKDGTLSFGKGYVSCSSSTNAFLPMTQRNIAIQAFKMLQAPYGWGELGFTLDCSSFIRRIFLTMGVELPRTSTFQVKVLNNRVPNLNRKADIMQYPPFLTFLYIHGHIMLYIGNDNDNPYVIQATTSFYKSEDGKTKKVTVNKVIVSDLNLNQGTTVPTQLNSIYLIGCFN
jgi:hypothetical protein